ncbi:hypothetical protein BOSE62_130596 [Bosea sp. 62]|nr:hypothetical protein BOSE21B_30295 [Bosea sp. 21B]CAD5276782.1 hypothetical protein BOSE46_30156 [Bosea sp. 46]VXB49908.1 hypothetical protein BOSE62_130596 [Bosea sp. 62]VXC11919.1 hypothetical protein BOSE127_170256 [Bosea sp. 127]VXC72497.1 hypothetical protein BOSE125_40156 [Bosea sp. 125]
MVATAAFSRVFIKISARTTAAAKENPAGAVVAMGTRL